MHGTLPRPDWFPDWSGDVCAVVASGESATQEDVDQLRGRCRIAVVNNGFELAPWADLLYAADGKWWDHYVDAQSFRGVKVTWDKPAARRYGLRTVELVGETDHDADRLLFDRPGYLGRGGNSAFQLVNLVTQFGAKRQIWLGLDLVGEHWHAKHPQPLRNPRPRTLVRWALRFDAQAELLASLGVEVINASAVSALTAYQKLTVREALERWPIPTPAT